MRQTAWLFLILTLPLTLEAKTLCVNVNTTFHGTADGSCWEKPYSDLQQALAAARKDRSIDQIWIAQGVYKPSQTYAPENASGRPVVGGAMSLPQYNPGITCENVVLHYEDNRERFNQKLITFTLVDGVSLYGGFKGNETKITDRPADPGVHQTILDGNLGTAEVPYHVWHVLTAGNDLTGKGVSVTLDRLVIRNGNARGAPYYPRNFYLQRGQIPIHYHDDGGGLYVFTKSQIHIHEVSFLNNQACAGGAIYAHDGSTIEIEESHFSGNQAGSGGAILVRNGGPNDLLAPQDRGSTLTVRHSIFAGNSSTYGNDILTDDILGRFSPQRNAGVKASVRGCQFSGNATTDR